LVVGFLLCRGASLAATGTTPMPVSPGRETAPTVVEARCPTFSWAGVAGARGYQLAVLRLSAGEEDAGGAESESEPELVARVELPADARSFTPPVGECLTRGSRYAWSVAAVDRDGLLDWSPALRFEVEATLESEPIESVEEAIAVLERYLAERSEASRAVGSGAGASPAGRNGREAAAAEHREPSRALTSDTLSNEVTRDERRVAPSDGSAPSESVTRVRSAASPTKQPGSLSVTGQIHLSSSIESSAIFKSTYSFLWDDSAGNLALGRDALSSLSNGTSNTAVGRDALRSTTGGAALGGSLNTAVGDEALFTNTTGKRNTGIGADALRANTTGFGNTATGAAALQSNTIGEHNVGVGAYALRANTEGHRNTAVGLYALRANTTGSNNTAHGARALNANTTAKGNTAIGAYALESVSTLANYNTAVGVHALQKVTDDYNTAIGHSALRETTTGRRNTALGRYAGAYNEGGDRNLFLGSFGRISQKDANATIWIGSYYHERVFVRGAEGVTTGNDDAIPLLIDSDGQLGTASSSRRFKQDIEDAGSFAARLLELRPVAFRYRKHAEADPATSLQFGLIAEEVAEVLPELVVFDELGRPETVKYHLLSSLLLAQVREQQAVLLELHARLRAVEAMVATEHPNSTRRTLHAP
jgi:hypothetical protein